MFFSLCTMHIKNKCRFQMFAQCMFACILFTTLVSALFLLRNLERSVGSCYSSQANASIGLPSYPEKGFRLCLDKTENTFSSHKRKPTLASYRCSVSNVFSQKIYIRNQMCVSASTLFLLVFQLSVKVRRQIDNKNKIQNRQLC